MRKMMMICYPRKDVVRSKKLLSKYGRFDVWFWYSFKGCKWYINHPKRDSESVRVLIDKGKIMVIKNPKTEMAKNIKPL